MKRALAKGKAIVSLAFFGIIALTLSGCSPMLAVSALPNPAPVAATTTLDEQALYAAEALYNVPAQAYVAANKRGTLPAPLKAYLKPKLLRMYKVLQAARSAYRAANASTFNARVTELATLRNDVAKVLPGVDRDGS